MAKAIERAAASAYAGRVGSRTVRSSFAQAAALLAVALLTLAGVRSVVMQAAMAAPAASTDCVAGMGEGMAMSAAPRPAAPDARPGKGRAACEFCAAAAQAPLAAEAPPLPAPTVVAWTPPPPTPRLGARGPPAFTPKARGPPALLLT